MAWEPLGRAWSSTGPWDPSWVTPDCRGLFGVLRGKEEVAAARVHWNRMGGAGVQKGRCAGLGPGEKTGGGVRRRNFAGSDWADRGKGCTVAQGMR